MYKTIMVNLDVFQDCTRELDIAAHFAERFHAHVIGISACRALQSVYEAGALSGDVIELDIAEIKQRVGAAEQQFRSAFARRKLSIEWRSQASMGSPSRFVLQQSTCADLLITGLDRTGPLLNRNRSTHATDLMMHAGRPVLVVPERAKSLQANNILIAWKDTRESRRAVADALPFLQMANRVVIASITENEKDEAAAASVADVAAWLLIHNVTAKQVVEPVHEGIAKQIQTIAGNEYADLIVAGAYGHSRFQEWALGGVTRHLLRDAESCSLMSH